MARHPRSPVGTRLGLVAGVLLMAWSATAEPPPEKDWEIRLTPYVEFSNIVGSVRAENIESGIDANFGDIFDRLNFAMFGEADVTWRASLLGSFALSQRWDIVVGYRALSINEEHGSGSAALDYVMHGPVLGVSLHF